VLQVQVTYCALPRQHSDCLQQQLQQVADLVSQQQLQAAAQLMDDVIEWQLGDFAASSTSSSSPASPSSSSSSPGTPMDTAAGDEDLFDALDEGGGALGGSEGSSVPAVAAAAVRRGRSIVGDKDSPLQRLAKAQLQQLAQAAPPDELAPVAAAMQALLGRRHPVCAALQLLAEANMGPGARQARELRRQQRQLAQATALLQVRVVCLCVCVCVCV
jgi:hypothetical protein